MERIILILLLIIAPLFLWCQDDYDGEGCSTCDFDCLMCDQFTTLVDSTAMTSTGDAQDEHCTFVEHQIQWFGFVAGSEDIELTITTDSCVGNSAVEILIMEAIDCTNATSVSNCFGAFSAIGLGDTDVVANDVPLVIGQYYWMVFDATSAMGQHCSFTLEVTDGITGAPPITDIPIIDGPSLLCDNESGTYIITNDIIGAVEFEWYVDGTLESTSEEFNFNPSGVGTYEICAAGISYCEAGPLSSPCFEVIVAESTIADIAFAICAGDCENYLGTTYCSGGMYQDMITNQIGCDSIIDIIIYEIDIDLEMMELGECVNGLGVELVLNPTVISDPPLDGSEIITWDWYYEGDLILNTTNALSIFGDLEGIYSVNYNISYLGTNCIAIEDLDLSFDDYAYDFDTVEDYGDVCDLDIVTYELLFAPYDASDFTVVWTVPPDAFITMGQGTPIIEVDWTGSGGQVCYTVTNFCTTSEEECFEVNVLGSIAPEISLDTMIICIDEIVTATALNIPTTYEDFLWSFTGPGTVVSGSLDMPTSLEIYWSSAGVYNILLLLNDGCQEYNIEIPVEVITNPIFPPYTCLVEGDILTIDWDDIPNVTNYSANAISGETGTFIGSSYQITNVNPGDIVQLEIIADGPCGPFSIMTNCDIPDCPSTDLVFQNMIPDTICINATEQIYDLTGFDNLGNAGIGSFSGNGVTDTINGIFDITAAGSGQHIISFIYSLNNGDCISKVFDTIQIMEEPIFSLTADEMIICIDDTVQLNLTGLENNFTVLESFDNPTYVNEDSVGYYSLSWEEPGLKMILLEIQDPYCGSYSKTVNIEVQSLPSLELICFTQTTNSITISWTTDPIYNNYDISLNGVFETTSSSPPFTVSGLPIDSTIFFSILPTSQSAVCPILPDTITCFTIDCLPVDVEIISPLDTFLCSTVMNGSAQLLLDYDNSLFDGTETVIWSGPGVTEDGMFTPDYNLSAITLTASLNYIDCSYIETITFLIETPPVLSLTANDEVCIDELWELNYSGEINNDYVITWESDSNISLSDLGPHIIDFDTPGSFFFTIYADNNNCFAESVTTTVTVLDSVRTPQINCLPGTDFINLIWSVADSECNGNFTILLNDVIIEENYISNNLLIENLELETDYQIEIINNSICICDSKSIVINCATIPCPENLLSITSTESVFCLDDDLQNISLTGLFDTELLSIGLMWDGPGISMDGVIDVSQVTEGIITYTLIYIDEDDCSFFTETEIEFISPPNFDFIFSSPPCADDNLGSFIFSSTIFPEYEYLIDNQIIDPSQEINLEVGSHILTVINDDLCQTSESFEINPSIDYNLEINGDLLISYNLESAYTVIVNPPADILGVLWTFNDSTLLSTSETVSISQPGILCATVQYNQDCELTNCIEIQVTNPNVYIPNIISTDNQSQNKFFKIFSNDINAVAEYLYIYDRWGNLIFSKEDILIASEEAAWNGLFKEKESSPGVYVFVAKVLFSNDQEELFTGNITLIK